VSINYRRILQNNIFTNTEQKYMMLLPFERGTSDVPPVPKTLPELRERINTAIGNVTQDMLERVWREWEYRLNICRVTRGATFLFQMVVTSRISVQYLWKYCFAKSSDNLYSPCIMDRILTSYCFPGHGYELAAVTLCNIFLFTVTPSNCLFCCLLLCSYKL
jgi:hypothetical protein